MNKLVLLATVTLMFTCSINAQSLKETANTNFAEVTTALTDKTVSAIENTNIAFPEKSNTPKLVDVNKQSLPSEMYSDLKSLVPDVKVAITSIAKSLNTTAEKLWDILVRQQYVIAFGHLCVLILSFVSFRSFLIYLKKTNTDLDRLGEAKILNILITLVFGVLFIVGLIHSTQNFGEMLTGFINPEFGVLKMIVNTAGYGK